MFDVRDLGIDPKEYQVQAESRGKKITNPKKPERCLAGYCKYCTLETDYGAPCLWCNAGSAGVFDYYDKGACPLGFWYRQKKHQKTEFKCYACSSIEGWWRKKGSSGRWICSECHPPAITKNEVAFRSNF
jgi:hypothetical protein